MACSARYQAFAGPLKTVRGTAPEVHILWQIRNLPVDLRAAGFAEPCVDLRKWPAPEKPVVGREWRRMSRLHNGMASGIDQRGLLSRITSPQDKHHGRLLGA